MLSVIRALNGKVLKFGGDALLIGFYGRCAEAELTARECAVQLLNSTKHFGNIKTVAGATRISIKIIIETGEWLEALLGDDRRTEIFITGSIFNRVFKAEESAASDCIILNGKRAQGLDRKQTPKLIKGESKPVRSSLQKFLPQGVLDFIRMNAAGEYRVVTVLFVQITGYDPDMPNLVNLQSFFRDLISITEKYRGSVNKIDISRDGSKVLVLFGAPISHERSAEYGVLAGLEILGVCPKGLELRLGLSGGYVYAGIVGNDFAKEYTVIGDTVNTAARLLSGKGSNRFVISDQSHVFLRDKFDFKRLKPLRVKGKRNLQKRYQPVKKIREELYKFPFVGRENEITKIRKEIISGNSLITVQGDPGIGKSRLIYELEKVLPDYVKVYHGSSEEIKGSYHIFATLIRNEAGFSFEDLSEIKKRKLESYVKGIAGGNDQLLRRIPFLGKMLFNLDYSNSIYDKVPVSLRFENLSEAIRLIVNSSKWKKQVVILDDIQWITKKDMDLINYLIHVTSIEPHPSPRSSFILLSRYDPDIIKFLNVPRGLRRTDILLGSLKEVDVKKMTARFLNNKVIPEEVARFLNKRSEGNPFYVEQFLLNLIERGALTEQKRSWVKTSLYKEEEFPENIWSAVMARVDRLEMVAKECLRVGSVIGIEFPEKILKGIINKDLKLSLDLTEREGLLFKVLIKEAEYMFRHTILKDVVYNSILLERQKRLHFSVAKFIERIYANDIERFFGDLAYHYNHAGEWGKSLEYSMKAGDSAAEQFREDDAAMYYKKGIWILENKFRDRKDLLCEQYEKLGKVMDRTGNPAEAERYFKKMVKTVPGNLKVKASSYMARAWVEEHRANYRKSKELFKTAISIFEKMKLNTSLRMKYASLLNFTGWVYCVTGELEKSGQVLKKGLDVIAKIKAGNEKVKREVKGIRAELLNHLGMLFFTRGYPVKALETHKQRLEIETELGRLAGLAGVKGNIGVIYHETGDYDTGHKYYTESLEINKKLGHKRGTAFCLHNLCLVEMARGDYEQGYIYAKETLEYCLELGERNLEAKVYGSFAEYFQYKNNLRKALEYNKKQIAILEDTGNVHVLAESYNSIGELLQFMRRFNEAYKYQEKALAISRKAGNKRQEGISLRNIGIILANQKKRKQGFSYLLKAREMLERLGNKYYVNSTVHAMLEIKFEEKDYNAAEKYAYESLSISREIGFKHAEVMALQFLGKINSEQGRKEEAEKYFKEADDLVK